MVDRKALTDELSVCGQIRPEDMAKLADAGFRTIINNRPNNEGEDQPSSSELAAAAEAAGLDYIHQPVVGGQIGDEDIDKFDALSTLAAPPVLAFCRTGTRCTHLWALSQATEKDPQELLAAAEQAGYDLSSLEPRLSERRS